MRVLAVLHQRGELREGAPGYAYATSIIDGFWAPPGSDLFHQRAYELAQEMQAEVRYAYSVLLGSP